VQVSRVFSGAFAETAKSVH